MLHEALIFFSLSLIASSCRVAFETPNEEASPADLDIIFSDFHEGLRLAERSGKYHHCDGSVYEEKPARLFDRKSELLSILLPPPSEWTPKIAAIVEDASRVGLAEHLYVDDFHGGMDRSEAFASYRFTAILLREIEERLLPQVLLDCFAHHSVPIVDAKAADRISTASRFMGLAMVKAIDFSPSGAVDLLHAYTKDAWEVQKSAMRLTQEWLHLRYRYPVERERYIESACRDRSAYDAVVTIFTRRRAFERRMTIRQSWVRALKGMNVPHYFIIAGADAEVEELGLLRREGSIFHDIIVLRDVPEEYPVGRKGLATIKWVSSAYPNASWWIKCDDDVYLRPAAILDRLNSIQPVGYYWGSFDRSGPVDSAVDRRLLPNKESVLPPYARGGDQPGCSSSKRALPGSLLAISMDLVLDIAELADECVEGSLSPWAPGVLYFECTVKVRLIQLPTEDASYGYYMYQLPRSYTIGDVDEDLFSMVPKCCTGEEACRGALYLPVQNSPTPATVGAL
ncbi:UDP-Gal betaGal beta 1,3-galactosyltransferase, polypeptide 6 [Perkinsus olseni]|uniref:UDP-Gal betaGal beta 1,3-galactosyltransferase, polypeptide 6 n=1 Tax=Perkinsus olseni TaxID=32597 RepID=A0A7J6M5J6_PEROL|nr:UDP-Gal betaGal beta 1,3-galactosyltransferase, polypeptide 6 [Perkinsus olseni]